MLQRNGIDLEATHPLHSKVSISSILDIHDNPKHTR